MSNSIISRSRFYGKNGAKSFDTFNASYNLSDSEQIRNTFNQLYEEKRRGAVTSAWFNPAKNHDDGDGLRPETIYLGENGKNQPTWQEPVYDMKVAREVNRDLREGRIDTEDAVYAPYVGEWQDRFGEWYSDLLKVSKAREMSPYRVAASGKITSDDNSTLNIVNVMAEYLGRDDRVYVLEQAVRKISLPNLRISLDTFGGFDVERDVPEGAEVFAQKGKFTRQEFQIGKQVSHIVQTDESELMTDRALMPIHIQHSAAKMRRLKADLVATALANADSSPASGADWGAYTSDHSTVDPLAAIGGLLDTIDTNGGIADRIASHPAVYREFLANTHIKGLTATSPAVSGEAAKVVPNVPGLNGVTWYVDRLIPNGIIVVYDMNSVFFFQGPVRTESYRDVVKGQNGYITRDWCGVAVADATTIKEMGSIN
jgi:hypothetical protein